MQRFARSARSDLPAGHALMHLLARLDLAMTAGVLGFLAASMALLLTQSRGALVALALASLVYLRLLRTTLIIRSRTLPAVLIAVAAVTAVSLLAFSGEATLQRFGEAEVKLGSRIAYYRATWEAMQERPLLGTGYGTYADAFRAYNGPETGTYFLDKAHSTYLQLLLELGWPAALALFSCVGCLVFRCWRGLAAGARHNVYPATVLACSVLVGVHALVDFSLEMPANALTFALLLGLGCAQARALEREQALLRLDHSAHQVKQV